MKPNRVELVTCPDGTYEVKPHWPGVDRPCTSWIGTGTDRQLAERLQRCMLSGACFEDTRILTDCNGKTFVSAHQLVLGRRLNADLRRLGY